MYGGEHLTLIIHNGYSVAVHLRPMTLLTARSLMVAAPTTMTFIIDQSLCSLRGCIVDAVPAGPSPSPREAGKDMLLTGLVREGLVADDDDDDDDDGGGLGITRSFLSSGHAPVPPAPYSIGHPMKNPDLSRCWVCWV